MAPLVAPSGVGKGEPLVIIPLDAYGPKAEMVISLVLAGLRLRLCDQTLSGGHGCHRDLPHCCSYFSSQRPGLALHTDGRASPPGGPSSVS